eukprot:12939029-Prorocentrum_lima.AAC.1
MLPTARTSAVEAKVQGRRRRRSISQVAVVRSDARLRVPLLSRSVNGMPAIGGRAGQLAAVLQRIGRSSGA